LNAAAYAKTAMECTASRPQVEFQQLLQRQAAAGFAMEVADGSAAPADSDYSALLDGLVQGFPSKSSQMVADGCATLSEIFRCFFKIIAATTATATNVFTCRQ
jgi:hypothetical protein